MSTVETTTPTMCHHVVRLRSEMTIAELATEWFRLQPFDESDEYADHSQCRCDRIFAIEDELTQRPATCADDVLHKFKVMEQSETDAETANGPIKPIVEQFEWPSNGKRLERSS